ncbi:hypothetical protein [Desulfococcus multivorans]|uniref:Uncharacterized protein n=1 Tax=Desulfococcus multivorans DSM 2059 TaxID=1121405 RepID=S7T7D7_DESML|nr:hypothetical protein [Desulfococcus multivorans]AOY60482.1 uncharacterized protein Dmul_37140 [Desulfococcus multivorans]AQV02576.1 hypothetical protein B2D07_18555 [Desulfococcus multivorans]EPR32501.1 hypothetical protein dsmv_0874 [Desulfococcus multivorans DSM 2059]SKA27740.1 hypothetical protein SAMN02745446_03725 [Desulfococcus multivorans DSM 2059]
MSYTTIKHSVTVVKPKLVPPNTLSIAECEVFTSRFDEENGLPDGLSVSQKGNIQIKLKVSVVCVLNGRSADISDDIYHGEYNGLEFIDYLVVETKNENKFAVNKSKKILRGILACKYGVQVNSKDPEVQKKLILHIGDIYCLDRTLFPCSLNVFGDRNTIDKIVDPSHPRWEEFMDRGREVLSWRYYEGPRHASGRPLNDQELAEKFPALYQWRQEIKQNNEALRRYRAMEREFEDGSKLLYIGSGGEDGFMVL